MGIGMLDATMLEIEVKKLDEYLASRNLTIGEAKIVLQTTTAKIEHNMIVEATLKGLS